MNNTRLKTLAISLIIIGIFGVLWFDQASGLDTPFLWFTHLGVFLALLLLAFQSVKRTIIPLLLWVVTYGYTMITLSSLTNLTDSSIDMPGSGYDSLIVILLLTFLATVATGLALFIHRKNQQE